MLKQYALSAVPAGTAVMRKNAMMNPQNFGKAKQMELTICRRRTYRQAAVVRRDQEVSESYRDVHRNYHCRPVYAPFLDNNTLSRWNRKRQFLINMFLC